MRFHVLPPQHTIQNKDYIACAYTDKSRKFCEMMVKRGHTVYFYGHEDADVICTEKVNVLSKEDWAISYGSYDYRKKFFKFSMDDYAYKKFDENAIREIQKRKQKNDFILPFWGAGNKSICDAHPDLICVEPGIGYAGGHWARFKVFESYAIYHAYYGLKSVGSCIQDWYDVVIPNFFRVDDFEYNDQKDDYFLFMGRIYEGKGVHIAIQVTEAIGAKLLVAGQNSLQAMGYAATPSHVTEIGYADVETRKRLMSRAKGAFVASLYNEPFGGVQIEMLLSGTPTITTDWGSFTENNIHGLTGYRCRTFDQFCWAAKNIDRINPKNCREWGLNFSMDRVANMYEEYFQSVLDVYTGGGWYEPHPERTNIDWLNKQICNLKNSETDEEFLSKSLNKLPKNSKFLVIGAMDGIKHDTIGPYIMNNRSWSGIMVEPVKDQFENLVKNFSGRDNINFENSAITETLGPMKISRIPISCVGTILPDWADGLSTLKKDISIIKDFEEHIVEETVNCITFEQLKEKYNIENLDILQIDCEGYDYLIFKQIWDSGLRPTIIKVEINYFSVDELRNFRNMLKNDGYDYRFVGDDIIAVK